MLSGQRRPGLLVHRLRQTSDRVPGGHAASLNFGRVALSTVRPLIGSRFARIAVAPGTGGAAEVMWARSPAW